MTPEMDEHRHLAPAPELDDLDDVDHVDEHLDRLRAALTQPVDDRVAERHIAAMVAASLETEPSGLWERLRGGLVLVPLASLRRTRVRPVFAMASLAGLVGLTAGLASADALPDPAQRFAARVGGTVGLDLPEPAKASGGGGPSVAGDPADPEANDHGQAVSAVAQDSELSGCEKGQAVREVATSKSEASEDAPGHSDDHDPCAPSEGAGNAGGASEQVNGDSETGPPESTPGVTAPGRTGSTPTGPEDTPAEGTVSGTTTHRSSQGSEASGKSAGAPAEAGD